MKLTLWCECGDEMREGDYDCEGAGIEFKCLCGDCYDENEIINGEIT